MLRFRSKREKKEKKKRKKRKKQKEEGGGWGGATSFCLSVSYSDEAGSSTRLVFGKEHSDTMEVSSARGGKP